MTTAIRLPNRAPIKIVTKGETRSNARPSTRTNGRNDHIEMLKCSPSHSRFRRHQSRFGRPLAGEPGARLSAKWQEDCALTANDSVDALLISISRLPRLEECSGGTSNSAGLYRLYTGAGADRHGPQSR